MPSYHLLPGTAEIQDQSRQAPLTLSRWRGTIASVLPVFRQRQNLEQTMPKFVIERDIPGAGDMTGDQLRDISQTSCRVLARLGYEIQWIQSYVTRDKIYCIY